LKSLLISNENFINFRILFSVLFFIIYSVSPVHSQSKDELQRKRDDLNKQIEYTRKKIDEAKSKQKNAENQLYMLDRQIALRQSLIQNINAEIDQIEQDMSHNHDRIGLLESDLKELKEEYGRMIYEAYKNRGAYQKLMFVFASDDFNQAFKRMKVMQQYASVRKAQADAILSTQQNLSEANLQLEQSRAEKEKLLGDKTQESQLLASDKNERQSALSVLKQEEKSLRKKQQQQEEEKQRLNQAIQKIIDDEIKASKTKNNGVYELTPSGKIESAAFEKNKNKLPWPVSRGVVTGKFGKQNHPFLPGITIDNKGLDISTDANTEVTAIFGGEVTKVFSIMGAGMNIIVTHGGYKTVYTNLKDLKVKAGDKIEARQAIGKVLTEGDKTILHLEIWQVNATGGTPLDPLNWLSPR
jgi:septal ring factor EnvC (AmiA/AmiB activator)